MDDIIVEECSPITVQKIQLLLAYAISFELQHSLVDIN